MTDNTLGQRIADGRKKLGLSQEAFGERLGVSRQAASKWESDAAVPEIDKLITMSKLFGVRIGWLLGVEDPELEPSLSEEQLSAVTELLCRYPTPCPERKSRRWLFWVCAGGIAACLALGCLGLLLPENQAADTAALEQQLESLSAGNAALEQQLQDHITQNGALEQQLQDQADRLYSLETELETLKDTVSVISTIDSGDPPIPPETTYPGNDLLESWTMVPKVDTGKGVTTLWFNGTTPTEYAKAELVAVSSSGSTYTALCSAVDTGYAAELTIPSIDGYTYYFRATNADGTQQLGELVGHKLSNLNSDTKPTVTFSREKFYSNKKTFCINNSEIILETPELLPKDQVITWSDLRIAYYCNDALVKELSLMDSLGDQSVYDRELEFRKYYLAFDLASRANGSVHSLRLDGSITCDGVVYSFSVPLDEWEWRTDSLY